MKGLYKDEKGTLLFAQNTINFPDGTKIEVKKYVKKKEGTDVHEGWLVFNTREAALKHFDIEETVPIPLDINPLRTL